MGQKRTDVATEYRVERGQIWLRETVILYLLQDYIRYLNVFQGPLKDKGNPYYFGLAPLIIGTTC